VRSRPARHRDRPEAEFVNIVSGVFTPVLAKHSKSFSLICTLNRSMRNSDLGRSGVSRMPLHRRSRNWIPFRNSRRQPSWVNSWRSGSHRHSSTLGRCGRPPLPHKYFRLTLKSNSQTAFGEVLRFKTAHDHTHHRLTSPLHPTRHVDSVGCYQLRIRHLGTELELLEPSLSFGLGEKRQQVLASQPVV